MACESGEGTPCFSSNLRSGGGRRGRKIVIAIAAIVLAVGHHRGDLVAGRQLLPRLGLVVAPVHGAVGANTTYFLVAQVTPTLAPLAASQSEVAWSPQATQVPFNHTGANPTLPATSSTMALPFGKAPFKTRSGATSGSNDVRSAWLDGGREVDKPQLSGRR